ncbi:MAG: PAS domain-containing sensor histidine kinase [Deltaproteobacteria bacterium]|nr:MAG: PAS domain-containing sensor histidine kinase [Deltaproteobacteria bacterium]
MAHQRAAPSAPGAGESREGVVRQEPAAQQPGSGVGQGGESGDVDDRARRIEALERRVALLESILEGIPDPVFVKDAAHRFVYVNHAMGRAVGHDPTVMIGRTDLDFFPARQVAAFWDRDDRVLQGGDIDAHIEQAEHSDGSQQVFSTRRARVIGPDGRPLVVGTVRDVSRDAARHARRDQELRVVRELLEQVTRQARIGILLVDRRGYVQHMSGPDLAKMGIGTDNAAGIHFHSFGGLWPEVVPRIDAALRGQSSSEVLHWRGRDRQVTVRPVFDEGGDQVAGAVLVSIDLAVLDEQERRRVHQERMDSLGRLAGGVAHDLNNLLSIVMMGTSTLRDALSAADVQAAAAQVSLLERSVERGARLSRQLAAFARRQVGAASVIDLHAHLRPARSFLESLIGGVVELDIRLCPQQPRVRVLPGQVEQLVINLVLHASAGAPPGSRVVLETACERLAADGELSPGDYVVIRVVDAGRSLPLEVRERLFEPFYDAGRGPTGMGLATCYGIARQAGGRAVARVDAQGLNVVEVFLPMSSSELTSLDDGIALGEARRHTGRILLVEDEDVLREQLTELLRTAGHLVVSYENGRRAADWLQVHAEDVDLVLSDVMMPGLRGDELVREVGGRVPFLLMSGFTTEDPGELSSLPGVLDVLAKPVRPDILLRAVQRVLARKKRRRSGAR